MQIEEVAGYENRLTRLTTTIQVMVAVALLLLASHAALWMELGKLNGAIAAQTTRIEAIARAGMP